MPARTAAKCWHGGQMILAAGLLLGIFGASGAGATLYAYENSQQNASEPEAFVAPLASYGMVLGPGDGIPGFLTVALDRNSKRPFSLLGLITPKSLKPYEIRRAWRATKDLDTISMACEPILPADSGQTQADAGLNTNLGDDKWHQYDIDRDSPVNGVDRMKLGSSIQRLSHQSTNRVIQGLYNKACSILDNCQYANAQILRNLQNKFALVRRGGCNFDVKTKNVQDAGYQGAVVFDPSDDTPRIMPGTGQFDIGIPSVMVGRSDASRLVDRYLIDDTESNPDEQPFVLMVGDSDDIINYLLPFSLIIAVCLTTMLIFSLVRVVRQWTRNRKARLTKKKLKKLPKKKYDKETDEWETCAVCLEDYEDDDVVRILPCNHAYHVDCIDPWLTRSRRNCPLCKRSVLSSEDNSDSELNRVDSDMESIESSPGDTQTTADQEPLLQQLLESESRSQPRTRNRSFAQRVRSAFFPSDIERSYSRRDVERYHDEEMIVDNSDSELLPHSSDDENGAVPLQQDIEYRLHRQNATRRRSSNQTAQCEDHVTPFEEQLPYSDESMRRSAVDDTRIIISQVGSEPDSSGPHVETSVDLDNTGICGDIVNAVVEDDALLPVGGYRNLEDSGY